MKLLGNFLDNIRPWELVIISLFCAVFFAFVDFGLSLGCSLGLEDYKPCNLIARSYGTSEGLYYFSLGWIQLLIMVVLVLFLYKKIPFKRQNVEWTKYKIIISITLSVVLFILTFNTVSDLIEKNTYGIEDKNKFLREWIVDCDKIIIKTPLFSYDPNEGESEKKRNLNICAYKYNGNKKFDIFKHELK